MSYLLNKLKEDNPLLEAIVIFSNGAGSQFKQKYLFSNLYAWEQEYSLSIKWKFFDGIGGTIKLAVWWHVKSETVHIVSAEHYAVVAAESCPNIHLHFISKTDIQEIESFLEAKWENVRAVPRTRQMHCFTASTRDKVMVADTSDSTQLTTIFIRRANDSDIEENESDSEEKGEHSESEKEEEERGKDSESKKEEEESQVIATTTEIWSVGDWVIVM